jgi:signal transduction histidine kinase
MGDRGGGLRETGRGPGGRQTTRRPLSRTYHGFVDWLKFRAVSIPPLFVDVTLALILGTVGAAQLWSKRSPFEGDKYKGPFQGQGDGGPGGGAGGGGSSPVSGDPDTLTYLLLGLCAGSLVFRSRWPLLTLAGVTAFGAAYLETGQPVFVVQLIVLVAVYSAVADSGLQRGVAILVSLACGAVLGGAIWLSDAPRTDAQWAMDAAWLLAAIFLGDTVRSRREIARQAELNREEEARRRVSDERLQIARDLHDVVGHNISLINVQAGAGAHVLYDDPAQAKETFENIRKASHETLQELRGLVGVLRDPSSGMATAPTVGMEGLEQLVQSFVDAGQSVELSVSGDRSRVTGITDLSAYRVVQEALTNTMRHAPGSHVRVEVQYHDDDVTISVTNDRGDHTRPREPGGGHGVLGMRERVAAIGGRIETGPDPDGGFHVRAVLPVVGGAS